MPDLSAHRRAGVGVSIALLSRRCSFRPTRPDLETATPGPVRVQYFHAVRLNLQIASRILVYMTNTERGGAMNSFGGAIDWKGQGYTAKFKQSTLGFMTHDFIRRFNRCSHV